MPKSEHTSRPPYIEVKLALKSIEKTYEKACDKAILANSQQKNITNYLLVITAGEHFKYAVSMIDYKPHKDLENRIIEFTKHIDEQRIEMEKEFREKLNEDKVLFTRTLDELNKCKSRLEDKKYNHLNASVDKQKAHRAIDNLYLNLQKFSKEYFSSDTTLSSFKEKYDKLP